MTILRVKVGTRKTAHISLHLVNVAEPVESVSCSSPTGVGQLDLFRNKPAGSLEKVLPAGFLVVLVQIVRSST